MTDETRDKLIDSILAIESNLEVFNIGVEINPEQNEGWLFFQGVPESAYAGTARFIYKQLSSDVRRLRSYNMC